MVFVVLPHHSYYRYFYPLTTVVMWLGATKNRTFNAEKPPFGAVFLKKGGPSDRIRTCGILLPKQARYQLRYTRLLSFLSGWSYSPKCRALPVGLHPDIPFSAMIPRRVIKIKIFLSVVIYVVKGDFVPFSATGEKPAIARVARLCGVSPHPIPDTTTALPKQARYQLRYTPIRYSLCIANPFLTALIVYWILAGKSTGRLHIPPE